MTTAPQPQQVRRLVVRTFQELGVPTQDLFELQETLRVEDRRHVARAYRAGGLMAMWLIPAGLVQFYDDQGRMLRMVEVLEPARTRRAAA